MKITIEPSRAKTFFENALAYSGGKGQAQSTVVKFTPEGAQIRSLVASDLLLLADYSKDFFLNPDTYEVKSPEELFLVTQTLIKEYLAHGFKSSKMVISTDAEWVYLIGEEGKDDKVRVKIIATDDSLILKHKVEQTEVGLMYHRKANLKGDDKAVCTTDPKAATCLETFNIQCLVPATKFTDLPTSIGEIQVVYNKDGLNLIMNDELSERTRPITMSRILTESPTPVSLTINKEILEQVIGQFTGEVWLSLNDKRIVISQKNKNYSLTYGLIAKQKEAGKKKVEA